MKYLFLACLVCINLNAKVLEVTASIMPQKFFIEQIGKHKVNVNIMVKPNFSPAIYEPKTSQMKLLSSSKAYFAIGVAFENVWLERFKFANKNMLIIDTSKGISKLSITEHSHKSHNEPEEHTEGSLDPHIWLDPMLVKIQSLHIYNTLVKLDAKNRDFYKQNLDEFLKYLDKLDKEIDNILKNKEQKEFIVFHPSWGYFAKRYNLIQIPVEKQGKDPKPKDVIALINEAKEHGIKVIFIAPQFSKKTAETIANAIKGSVITVNPLAYLWSSNLKKVARTIKKSY